MTMSLNIPIPMEFLVIIYWLLDYYFFIRTTELWYQAYYKQKAEDEEDCIHFINKQYSLLTKENVLDESYKEVKDKKVLIKKAVQPNLGKEPSNLLVELTNELNEVDDIIVNETELYTETQDFYLVNEEEEQFIIESQMEVNFESNQLESNEDCLHEEDCILIEDYTKHQNTEISTGYENFASAKIMDCIDGPQQWVVKVLGMEEHYIHVSDGKRVWINVGERVHKLKNGDSLILDVIRQEKNIKVQNIIRVDGLVTDEYAIPDENYNNVFIEERIAI